ncbi:MAG: Pvc16 family protein [Cyanobacteria bacterium J06623_4]
MSNALAIAATSAVLKDVLENGMVEAQLSNDFNVRVGPPVSMANGSSTQQDQITLFLYQVTPNIGWRNECLPRYNRQGDRVNNPPLALNLHYLLTTYSGSEFGSEVLLGHAMQILHENTFLSQAAIRRALSSGTDASVQALAAAGLAEQVERVKITPENLDPEAMSRLWSSLQANFRTSTAYQVSVVLIEKEESTKVAPPVLNRRVFALPVRSPVISQVDPQLITAGGTLMVKGQGLKGSPTQVAFGNEAVSPLTLSPGTGQQTDQQISVALPAGLQAGVNTVQVLHPFDLETPVEPHRGVGSNVVAFMLRPDIVKTAAGPPATYDMAFFADEAAFNGAFSADERSRFTQTITFPAVRLRLAPVVSGSQTLTLLLNEIPAPTDRPARAYSYTQPALLLTPADIPPTGTAADVLPADQRSEVVVFSVPGATAGDYLVRIRVDGADSPLERAPISTPSDPVAPFIGPVLEIRP